MADREGRTPLHHAALEDRVEDVRRMLKEGADPNSPDRAGFTPLHFAAQQWSVASARVLLDGGARVDVANIHGNTPLFTAVFNSRGRGELIDMLRRAGADPNRANRAGQTPLGLARLIANFDVEQHFGDSTSHVTFTDAD